MLAKKKFLYSSIFVFISHQFKFTKFFLQFSFTNDTHALTTCKDNFLQINLWCFVFFFSLGDGSIFVFDLFNFKFVLNRFFASSYSST